MEVLQAMLMTMRHPSRKNVGRARSKARMITTMSGRKYGYASGSCHCSGCWTQVRIASKVSIAGRDFRPC